MASSQGALPPRGMPILSGPPPVTESSNCRQCNKPFNIFTRRSHACGHCGYEYCSTCMSDGQALMPRRSSQVGPSAASSSGGGFLSELRDGLREGLGLDDGPAAPGYEVERVCLYCLSMLQVTSAPIQTLRSLPLKRLKEYIAAYDIPLNSPKEKDDFVQAVVKARNPQTGCLSPEAESFYRRKSVPKGGQPPRPTSSAPPRPAAQPAPRQSTAARPPPPTSASTAGPSRPASTPQNHYHSPQPRPAHPSAPRPQTQARPPPPAATATPPPRQPSPPVPSISSLVSLPRSYLSTLSIGTLKAILYENHVRVDFKQVLEKEELVNRVHELIVDERKILERQRYEEERLAHASNQLNANGKEEGDALAGDGESLENGTSDGEDSKPRRIMDKRVPTGPMPEIERGLCVVCQDEEATLAVVDCGHLCMCGHCSDLIMATSQECPLCRTRIITKQRLIRIYRV